MTFNINYILDELYRFDITWCFTSLIKSNIYKVNTWTTNTCYCIFCYETYIPGYESW